MRLDTNAHQPSLSPACYDVVTVFKSNKLGRVISCRECLTRSSSRGQRSRSEHLPIVLEIRLTNSENSRLRAELQADKKDKNFTKRKTVLKKVVS